MKIIRIIVAALALLCLPRLAQAQTTNVRAQSGALVDCSLVALGCKADAKSTATDTTAVTIMQVLKEISAMEQAPASRAVTNAGTFAVQDSSAESSLTTLAGAISSSKMAVKAASGDLADGAVVTLGAKADAKSTATDTTAITQMQVDKQISFNGQNPMTSAALNPTNALTLPSTTTAYSAGTLICTSATVATCNTALGSQLLTISNSAGAAIISRLRLTSNDATATAWGTQTIQIDLWSAAPQFATTGDRGSFTTDFSTGSGGHLAAFTCVMSAVLASGVYSECSPTVGNFALLKLASGTSIFWTAQAVTGSGVTGASKVFTLTAEMLN